MSTIPQLAELRRRKSDLALKAARYGINTPAEIAIEKSDLETVIGLMERIDIHRQRLAVLIRQRDHFGQNAPPHLETEVANIRSQIAILRNQCARLRYPVDEHTLDADNPAPLPEPQVSVSIRSEHPDRLTRLEQKIDRILQLLEER